MRRSVMPVLVFVAALLASFALVRLPRTIAQEATPDGAECPTTTAEENKALVSQVYEAIDSGDEAAMVSLMATDLVYHTPSQGERTGDPSGFLRSQREDFPDATATVDLQVAEGDMVAAYLSWSGTHQDEHEGMGIPETGRTADWVSAVFFRVECGKIAEVWPLPDRFGQLRDIGVITEEELQSADAGATPTP